MKKIFWISIGFLILFIAFCCQNCTLRENVVQFFTATGGFIAFLAFLYSFYTYKGQKQANALERFDSEFFNMLTLIQTVIERELIFRSIEKVQDEEADEWKSKYDVRGRDVFRFLWEEYPFMARFTYDNAEEAIEKAYLKDRKGMLNVLAELGTDAYKNCRETYILRPYFNLLISLLTLIGSCQYLDEKQKQKKADVVQATISPYELVWIYCECYYGEGKELKNLVEKYSLLKYIDRDLLPILPARQS